MKHRSFGIEPEVEKCSTEEKDNYENESENAEEAAADTTAAPALPPHRKS